MYASLPLPSVVLGTAAVEVPKKQKRLQSHPPFKVLTHNMDQGEKSQNVKLRHRRYQLGKVVAKSNAERCKKHINFLIALLG